MDCNIAFKTANIKLSLSRVHKQQSLCTNVHNKIIDMSKCAQFVQSYCKCAQLVHILHIYINI